MSRDGLLFLDDIIESARKIEGFLAKRDFDAFFSDEGIFDAVLMNLLIIGEAAKNLPPDITAAMPEIDWSGTAGLRDIIAHHYFGIDAALVWDIVRNHVPAVLESATALRDRLDDKEGHSLGWGSHISERWMMLGFLRHCNHDITDIFQGMH